MRSKKALGWGKFARVKGLIGQLRFEKLTRMPRRAYAAAIAIVVIGVAASAMLMAAYRQSSPAGNTTAAAYRGPRNAVASDMPDMDQTAENAPAAESAVKASVARPVTITGCLERDDETFRLKDTAGAGAPKSRSWKTAFLKKGSASIEVVDAANRVRLPGHVGERVSVTGIVVDREMQVRSLRRVAPSCEARKGAKS